MHTSLSKPIFFGKTPPVQVSHGGHVPPEDRGLAGGAAMLEHEEPHFVDLIQARMLQNPGCEDAARSGIDKLI